jgi:acyl-CoA thioesterase FadM
MFVHRKFVRLEDTDATGVIFFPNQLKFALESLEHYFKGHLISL